MIFSNKTHSKLALSIALSLLIASPFSYAQEKGKTDTNNSANKSKEETSQKSKKRKKTESGYYNSFMEPQETEQAEANNKEKKPHEEGYYASFTTKRELPYAAVPIEPTPIHVPKVEPAVPIIPIPAVTSPATKQPGWKDNIGETGSITTTRHITLAREFTKNGQYSLAKRHFIEAVRLSPDSYDYAIDFYRASMKAGDWAQAANTLEKLILNVPTRQKEFYADYGKSLFENKDYDKAIPVLKKAAGAGKNLEQVHKNLLNIYLMQSNSDLAAVEYEQILKLNPNNADIHSDYGTMLWRMDKLPQAIVHYKTATRLKPLDAKIQGNLGYALLYAKDYAGSVAAYKKAAALNPSDRKIQEQLKFAQQQQNIAENQ